MRKMPERSCSKPPQRGWVEETALMQFHQRCIEEITKHKWIESEKVGFDIGWTTAKRDWYRRYVKEFQRGFIQRSN